MDFITRKDLGKYSNHDNDPNGSWMSDNLTGLAGLSLFAGLFVVSHWKSKANSESPANHIAGKPHTSRSGRFGRGSEVLSAFDGMGRRVWVSNECAVRIHESPREPQPRIRPVGRPHHDGIHPPLLLERRRGRVPDVQLRTDASGEIGTGSADPNNAPDVIAGVQPDEVPGASLTLAAGTRVEQTAETQSVKG